MADAEVEREDHGGGGDGKRWNHGRVYGCGMVPPSKHLKSLDRISLEEHLRNNPNFGAAGWKRRILRGRISVDGTVVTDPGFGLAPGSRVSYHRAPWREPPVRVLGPNDHGDDPGVLVVLHEDPDLLVVHKPSGLPTMPSQTFYEYSVLRALREHYHSCASPPQPVHRLGVGTSGVLLVATSQRARKGLAASIRDRSARKVYRALVEGADVPDALEIDCPIGPVPFPISGGTIHAACPRGGEHDHGNLPPASEARSILRVVRRNPSDDTAVVEFEIPTGRPHQIRIHAAFVGHPLVGDPLYRAGGVPDHHRRRFPGRPDPLDEDPDTDDDETDDEDETAGAGVFRVALPRDVGYSLHAHRITVDHPGDGRRVTFVAPPPPQLRG